MVYLGGNSSRNLGDGSRAGHDGEGAGGGSTSELADSGTGNEAHF